MANYADDTSLDNTFGQVNINIWADLNNRKSVNEIQDRRNWACETATEYINGRLVRGKYSVPFVNVPKQIKHITTLLAGMLLYDGRRAIQTGDQGRDQISHVRKEFHRQLNEILSGRMRLLHPTTGEPLDETCEVAPQTLEVTEYPSLIEVDGIIIGSRYPRTYCNICCCRYCICKSLSYPAFPIY